MVFWVLVGCSAVKKESKTIDSKPVTEFSEIVGNNITGHNFFIQKASINIENKGEEKKLLGTLKFNKDGTYLFSIRNIAGMEAARILITKDTVLVNDRINSRLFYGSSKMLAGKYGISFVMIPLIFGDYVDFHPALEKTLLCENGTGIIEYQENERKISYEIDCTKGKIINTVIKESSGNDGIRIVMKKFISSEKLKYPKLVILQDIQNESTITLKIEKIGLSEDEKIEFFPGKNYDKVLLK